MQFGSGDALQEEMARLSLLPPPPLDDFDDVSNYTVPEELEFTYPDSTDNEPSENTTNELPSLNDESEMSEHHESEKQQTEPMKIDEGVENCNRCHLLYYGTAEQHNQEC
jgi:hypothetical protein